MASQTKALTILLCLGITTFFTLVSSSYVPCPPPPSPSGHHGGPSKPTPPPPTGHHHHGSPTRKAPPTPIILPPPSPSSGDKCPINVLKLAACGSVLSGLVGAVIGVPPEGQCCSVLEGLTDLDAALCLCTALEADILGVHLDIPVSLSVLLNFCDKAGVPSGFQCPSVTPTPTTPSTPPTPTIPIMPKPPSTPKKPTPPTPTIPIMPTPPSAPKKPSPPSGETCPINVLKLGACANVLNGLVDAVIGIPPESQCCPLLEGLTDLDAALCLCTALKANVLGIDLNVGVSLSLLLNFCNKAGLPSGFQCP